jgi:hypothetical protein
VPADAWNNQSYCSEWTASDAAGHTSWVLQSVTAEAAGTESPAQATEAEVAGDDPAATMRSGAFGPALPEPDDDPLGAFIAFARRKSVNSQRCQTPVAASVAGLANEFDRTVSGSRPTTRRPQ